MEISRQSAFEAFILVICMLIYSFSSIQAQENLASVELREIAQFGLGIAQDNVSYDRFLVSPNEDYLAVLSSENIEIWSISNQNLISIIERPFGDFGFGVFDWSPDSSQIATITGEIELNIWDVSTGDLVQTLAGIDIGSNGTRGIDWYQTNLIATGSFEYLMWNIESNNSPQTFACHPWGSRLWWSPNGEYVATMGGGSSLIWVCDNQFEKVVSIEGYTTIAWSPDSTEIATVGILNTLRVWDISSGEVLTTSETGESNIRNISWNLDGNRIVTGHLSGEVQIWERLTPNAFGLVTDAFVTGLSDVDWVGNNLITINNMGIIQLWEVIDI